MSLPLHSTPRPNHAPVAPVALPARTVLAIAFATVVATTGCAGPGPRMFPPTPLSVSVLSDGRIDWLYDVSGDGVADYAERSGQESGRIETLRFDDDHDGAFDQDVVIADVPAAERRDLVMILDSVPYTMVEDLWRQGRFRYFHKPARVVSPFPVMTDLCLAEFFDVSPCPGVEAEYFADGELQNGYWKYLGERNTPWVPCTDYRMSTHLHAWTYFWPYGWFGREMRRMQNQFMSSDGPLYVGYYVGTSALGAKFGRNGHQSALVNVDRYCRQIMYDTRGRTRFTLFSDHGHNLVESERIPLREELESIGYHVGERLERPEDVVVPEFGQVTCAAIHAMRPESVARDVLGVEGVEITACMTPHDRIIVLSRDGRAVIVRDGDRLSYTTEYGDPLKLLPLMEGVADEDGFISDERWFEISHNHTFPDPVHRLWRAFHGLVESAPQVLVSIEDGYHCGSETMAYLVELAAAHGSLRWTSTCGFAMTSVGALPDAIRMDRLRITLAGMGVPFDVDATPTRSP